MKAIQNMLVIGIGIGICSLSIYGAAIGLIIVALGTYLLIKQFMEYFKHAKAENKAGKK